MHSFSENLIVKEIDVRQLKVRNNVMMVLI